MRISAIDTVDARELIGEKGVLHIMLDGETYILRLTRKDRLILTR